MNVLFHEQINSMNGRVLNAFHEVTLHESTFLEEIFRETMYCLSLFIIRDFNIWTHLFVYSLFNCKTFFHSAFHQFIFYHFDSYHLAFGLALFGIFSELLLSSFVFLWQSKLTGVKECCPIQLVGIIDKMILIMKPSCNHLCACFIDLT